MNENTLRATTVEIKQFPYVGCRVPDLKSLSRLSAGISWQQSVSLRCCQWQRELETLSSHVSREALTPHSHARAHWCMQAGYFVLVMPLLSVSHRWTAPFRVQRHQINCPERIFKPLPLTNSKFSIPSVKTCILNLSHNGVGQPCVEFCSVTISVPRNIKISDFPWSLCLW